MKKLFRIALVASLAAGAFALHSPAQATPGAAVFAGTATTPPLGYPIHPGNAGEFHLESSLACVENDTNSCYIVLDGNVTAGDLGGAWCGHSSGTGSGTYSSSTHNGTIENVEFSTAGGAIEFSGDLVTAHGTHEISGVANATPTGGSCATRTATEFTVAGVAAIN